jgi:hypothetical protein
MQATMPDGVVDAPRLGVGFLWTAAWAIITGPTITSLVQVHVSRSAWLGSWAMET